MREFVCIPMCFSIFVAVRADGTITVIIKEGCGSLRIDSVMDMIEVGL